MFKNIFYNNKRSEIHLWEQINGEDFYDVIPWVPYIYEEDNNGQTHTIDGKLASIKLFNTYRDYYNYQKECGYVLENKTKPEIQFLAEKYHKIPDDEIQVPNLKIYTIDIEVDIDEGFPKPEDANAPICLISIKNYITKKIVTFGLKSYNGERNVKYYHCNNERDLLNRFFTYMFKYSPDVITGWNCVPINSYIFGSNYIDNIYNIEDDSILFKYPKSIKNIVNIELANGKVLQISKDHVIPVVYGNNEKYTNFRKTKGKNEWLKFKELRTKDILLNENESYFVEQPIHKNKNKDKKISDDIIYLLGLIFTDGSIRNKKNKKDGYKIYQSDFNLMKTFDNILKTKICGPYKKCYSRSIKYSLINNYCHSLIFDKKNEKRLNVKELSKLSYRQFMIFLSGLLDGDGFKFDSTIGFCNYNNQIDNLLILCEWNGIFCTKRKNTLRFLDINFSDLKLRKIEKWKNLSIKPLKRNNSQKLSQTNYKKVDNKWFIKIKKIEFTNKKTEMIDIKTKSGYFISNGIKVHNCYGFDLPYIINRCKNIFEEKRKKIYRYMSPIKVVRTWDSKRGDMNIDIAGVDILDYYQLYKWYSPNNLESYRLDYVSKFELEKGKLDYSEYENLKELMEKNWNKFVDYNIDDVNRVDELEVKLGYIRLVQALSLLTKCPMKYYDAMTHLIEGAMLTYYRRNNLCAPYFAGGTQEGFEAAYVKDPQQGMHEWIIDIDITSSYPSHIITLNMSNETYLGKIIGIQEEVLMKHVREKTIPEFEFLSHKKGLVKYSGNRLKKFNMAVKKGLIAISPCGSCFSTREPGVISTVEKNIFFKRKEVKQQMKDLRKEASKIKDKKEKSEKLERAQELFNFQWALKILLNAVFGVTSVPYSRYFNTNIAEAITSCGRYTIKQGQKFTNNLLNNPDNRLIDILNKIDEYKK